jgi:formyltetrahydrofolate synthetase
VTLRINWVRLMDENDRLLQKVRELERQNEDLMKQLEHAGRRPA